MLFLGIELISSAKSISYLYHWTTFLVLIVVTVSWNCFNPVSLPFLLNRFSLHFPQLVFCFQIFLIFMRLFHSKNCISVMLLVLLFFPQVLSAYILLLLTLLFMAYSMFILWSQRSSGKLCNNRIMKESKLVSKLLLIESTISIRSPGLQELDLRTIQHRRLK